MFTPAPNPLSALERNPNWIITRNFDDLLLTVKQRKEAAVSGTFTNPESALAFCRAVDEGFCYTISKLSDTNEIDCTLPTHLVVDSCSQRWVIAMVDDLNKHIWVKSFDKVSGDIFGVISSLNADFYWISRDHRTAEFQKKNDKWDLIYLSKEGVVIKGLNDDKPWNQRNLPAVTGGEEELGRDCIVMLLVASYLTRYAANYLSSITQRLL